MDKFCVDIVAVGAKGLFVLDILLEEMYDVSEIVSKYGIEFVLFFMFMMLVEWAKKIA